MLFLGCLLQIAGFLQNAVIGFGRFARLPGELFITEPRGADRCGKAAQDIRIEPGGMRESAHFVTETKTCGVEIAFAERAPGRDGRRLLLVNIGVLDAGAFAASAAAELRYGFVGISVEPWPRCRAQTLHRHLCFAGICLEARDIFRLRRHRKGLWMDWRDEVVFDL